MRRLLVLFALAPCMALLAVPVALASQPQRTVVAPLSGAEEVPSADTLARGQTVLQLSKDGTELRYRVNVANIRNVSMAHIHLAPTGVNGPEVVWLYPEGSPPAARPRPNAGDPGHRHHHRGWPGRTARRHVHGRPAVGDARRRHRTSAPG